MRSLLLLVTIALAAPGAEAGEFIAREPKPAAASPAPAAKARPRAKPVRKITRTAAKPKKKSKRHEEWKRPMP